MPKPLITPPEHRHQHLLQAVNAIVEVRQQQLYLLAARLVGLETGDQLFRGQAVETLGVFGNLGHAAETAHPRHAPHQGGIEAVDRLDRQQGRVLKQVPAEAPILPQCLCGQVPGTSFVRLDRRLRPSAIERLEQPVAHLGGGLAGESDRQNTARIVDVAEQGQKTLNQQFGLARAGGRLDDEGAARIDRRGSLFRVDNRITHRSPPRTGARRCGKTRRDRRTGRRPPC